jgi:lysophospholipase L1-like esterase
MSESGETPMINPSLLLLHAASTVSLALGPVIAAQGAQVRRAMPQLPGAAGPTTGRCAGLEPALQLLTLGESTVAGVGAASHAEALTGQVAVALAERLGRGVTWRACGQTGITASATRRTLVPALPAAPLDVVLVALGVNDTLRFRSPARWRADLTALIAALRERVGPTPVFLAAVPPMGAFPSLPQPLRAVLGLRAHLLDQTTAELAPRLSAVTHVPVTLPATPELFAADGFHPGPAGYQRWGAFLAARIVDQLRNDGLVGPRNV